MIAPRVGGLEFAEKRHDLFDLGIASLLQPGEDRGAVDDDRELAPLRPHLDIYGGGGELRFELGGETRRAGLLPSGGTVEDFDLHGDTPCVGAYCSSNPSR
jgi:hypothetical protein